jgi:hypothetical protein
MILLPPDFKDFLKLLNSNEVEYLLVGGYMGVPPLRIELLTSISGVNFTDCFSRRIVTNIDDIRVNIISLADLKTNKKASGRHNDLNDLEHLA